MSNFRTRERFLRIPPSPKPEPTIVEPTVTIVEPVEPPKPEPARLLAPISTARFVSSLPTRDDCRTCNDNRDELERLPVGLCGPGCLMARVRRGVA